MDLQLFAGNVLSAVKNTGAEPPKPTEKMRNKILSHKPFEAGALRNGLQKDFDFLCVDCKKPFMVSTGRALRCPPCKKIYDKAWQKRYHAKYVKKKRRVNAIS